MIQPYIKDLRLSHGLSFLLDQGPQLNTGLINYSRLLTKFKVNLPSLQEIIFEIERGLEWDIP
jgi:ATP/maltotriose-dependent transcriptional regulator MalT